MSRIERLAQQVKALSPADLARFRAWFLEFDWAEWDRQIERDAHDGKFDKLAAEAFE